MMSLVKEKSRSRNVCGQKTSTPSGADGSGYERGVDKISDKEQDHFNQPLYDVNLLTPEQDTESISRELLDGSLTGSPTKFSDESLSHLSEDTDSIQFRMEFEDNLSKATDVSDSDFRTPDTSLVKSYPCENLHSSAPKSGKVDECPKCSNVKSKLVAAKEEIKKLKKELKEAHSNFDNLEMFSYKLTQDIKIKEDNYNSQIALMSAKIDDLTSKFSLAEKNYRQLKQKTAKNEGKERKRSSLKNKEGLSLTKEYELKLCDLEKKVGQIETTLQKESVGDSENALSNELSNSNANCCPISSESSDTSSSTDISANAGKGFLSRLQSLGSKVSSVEELVSEKNEVSKEQQNPKILLEVRDTEESSHLDEDDHLWALSFNNSYKNLEKILHVQPTNLLECQGILLRKISKILRWLKSCLDKISKNSNLSADQTSLSQSLVSSLDSLCLKIPHNAPQPNQEREFQTFLIAFEIIGHLIRVSDVDNVNSLVKFDVTKFAFKAIVKTMCIAFAEYNQTDISHVLQLVSEIPEIKFFCPILNKLLPNNQEDAQYRSISERFRELAAHESSISSALHEAKGARYESLWDTLTEIPVQDDNVTKPRVANSIQNYVASIATNVYHIAKLQLHGLQNQSCYVLKIGQDKVDCWCRETEKALTDSLIEFMDELKERCPMLYERTVSLNDLNEFTRKAIACYVSELSFFSLSNTVLNCLFHHNLDDSQSNGGATVSHSLPGNDWADSSQAQRLNFRTNIEFFECLQCTTLSNLLCDSVNETNWFDFVKKYNACNPRQYDFSNPTKAVESTLNDACAKCDSSHFSESGNTGNAKDVCNNLTCTECDKWIKKFCAFEEQHEQERKALESKYSQDVLQLEECLIKSSEIHEKEMLQKENELESTTAQLQSLKIEYEAQIRALQNLYEKKLQLDCDSIDEERIRRAYKSEIEDLKDMFKKGLLEIENSHYRITTEIERKHKEEMSILKADKDRALELEAQATITALEAIRKSYEQQLKEETATIKQDLLRKFQNGEQNETFYCKYGSDLEKLKGEIVNITELYSAKCMENMALEDQVNTLRQQLDEAHKELCGLLMKNKEIDLSFLHV